MDVNKIAMEGRGTLICASQFFSCYFSPCLNYFAHDSNEGTFKPRIFLKRSWYPLSRLYQLLQGAFSLMVFFTYPLQLLVSVEIIKTYFATPNKRKMTQKEYFVDDAMLRSLLVFLTCKYNIVKRH